MKRNVGARSRLPFVPPPEFVAWRDDKKKEEAPTREATDEERRAYLMRLMAREMLGIGDQQDSVGYREFCEMVAFLFFVSSRMPGGFPLKMHELLKLVKAVQAADQTCPLRFICTGTPGAMTLQEAVLFQEVGKPDELMCSRCASAVIRSSSVPLGICMIVGTKVREQPPADDATGK